MKTPEDRNNVRERWLLARCTTSTLAFGSLLCSHATAYGAGMRGSRALRPLLRLGAGAPLVAVALAYAPLAAPAQELARPAQPVGQRRPAAEVQSGGPTLLESLRRLPYRQIPGASIEDLISEVAFHASAQQVEPETASGSDYPPSIDRVSIEHDAEVPLDRILKIVADAGLAVAEVEPSPRPGWTLLRIPGLVHSERRCDPRLAAVAGHPEVRVATPVLEGEAGWAIPCARVAIGLVDGALSSVAEVLAEVGSLSLEDATFAGMDRTSTARTTAKDGLEIVALARALRAHPSVAWAEPELLLEARADYIPNDPEFPNQWGLRNTGQFGGTAGMDMDVDLAWDVTRGSSAVRVLVLDTGTDGNHPDLNEWARRDFTGVGLNACDNHGTAVGGCIAALIDNNRGVAGVSPLSPILSARIFVSSLSCDGSGSVNNFQYADALDWGQTNGARVSNASLQTIPSSVISSAYSSTRSNGMVHIAAGGNNNTAGSVYPGNLTTVQEVGAMNPQGTRATFSNRGFDFVFAPGESIRTTDRTNGGYAAGDYVTIDGTSFAAPYTAGIAALILAVYPQALPAEVENILRVTTTDLGFSGRDSTYGWGLVNARRAVDEALRLASQCQVTIYRHPVFGGFKTGGDVHICSSTPLQCGTDMSAILQNVPPNQIAWMVIADQLQPTANPLFGSGLLVDPTPITSIQVMTDAQGKFCLPGLPNCGSAPLFVQFLWTIPNQSTFGVSDVVMVDYGPQPTYRVGANETFGRIQHAVTAAYLHPLPPFGRLVEVASGTYDESVSIRSSVTIREAVGATAVLHSTGTVTNLIAVENFSSNDINVTWSGIDVVADGTIVWEPIRIMSDAGGDTNVDFSNLTISDVNGVSSPPTAGFFRIRGRQNQSDADLDLFDVTILTDDFAYKALFEAQEKSSVNLAASGAGYGSAAGGGTVLRTSSLHVAEVASGGASGPGVYLRGADITHTSTQGESFVSDGGTIWLERVKLQTPANGKGVGTYRQPIGTIIANESILDARQGTQAPLFDLSSGSGLQLSFLNTAILFDAAATGGHAVIRAPLGAYLYIAQSTITSVQPHPLACVVDGVVTTQGSTDPVGELDGAITGNIFELPGSDLGVVRSAFGSVALEPIVENVRHCPGGFPSDSDQLPGYKIVDDPMLASDGYHLTTASSALPRQKVLPGFDLDGQPRAGFGVPSSTFGCDHTVPTFQTGLMVGSGQTYATIQAAINAASPGQTIVVHGGTYDEKIVWNKPVNIVEAWGAEAKLRPSVAAGNYVIRQTGWPADSAAIWHGIDVEVASNGVDVVLVEGANGAGACTVRFRSCAFTDGPTGYPGQSYFRVQGPTSFLALENARVEPTTHFYGNGFEVNDSSYISVTNGYVSFAATETADVKGGGQVAFNECELVDRGSTIFQVDGNGSSGSLHRSIVRTKEGRGTGAVGVLLGGACVIGVNRSIIDATYGTAASPFWLTRLNQGSVHMSESAVIFHSGRTTCRGIIDASLGGQVTMTHSTVRNVEDLAQFRSFGTVVKGPAQANATLTGMFQANLFDIDGSAEGAIHNVGHLHSGSVLVTASENVVHVGAGSLLWDRLPGTKLNLQPHLASDHVHLTRDSAASLPRTNASSGYRDIEYDARPAPNAFSKNFGCDEILP